MNSIKSASRPQREGHTRSSSEVLKQAARQRGIDGLLDRSDTKPAQRAAKRIQLEHLRRQKNLETIILMADDLCQDEAGHELDIDWLSHFLKQAEEIGSPAMQQLWARILARELGAPGGFSRKALDILRSMAGKEAQLFQRVCALSSIIDEDHNRKLLVGFRMTERSWKWLPRQTLRRLPLGKYRVPISSLMLLGDLGLLHANELDSGILSPDRQLDLDYQGQRWLLRPYRPVALSYYRLTPIGNELAELLPATPVEEYQHALLQLLQQGFQWE